MYKAVYGKKAVYSINCSLYIKLIAGGFTSQIPQATISIVQLLYWCKNISTFFRFMTVMVWFEARDLVMLKEVAAEGVLKHRMGSRERRMAWHNVARLL